jgi:lysophospholipase L1-like esterase
VRDWRIDDVSIRLQQVLRASSAKFTYVDLTASLKEPARAGVRTYLSDDTHWTTAGHEVVAHALQEALRSAEAKQLSVRAMRKL